MPGEERVGARAVLGLVALLLATFVAVTTELAPVGLLPRIEHDYRVSASTAGLLLTTYAVLVAAMAVPLTLVTARAPRKPLLLATIGLYVVANVLSAAAPAFGVVVAARVVGGLAHAVFFSVTIAYSAALVPARLQGRAIAAGLAGASLGYVAGTPLATTLGNAAGQRAAFWAIAVGAFVVAVLVAAVLPVIPARPVRGEGRGTGSLRTLSAVAGTNVLVFFAQYALYTYVSVLLLRDGVPESGIGGVLLLIGASAVIGLWLASLLVDLRPRAGLVGATALATVCVGLLLVVVSPGPVIGIAMVWGVAFGAFAPFLAPATLRTRALAPDLSGAVNNAASNVGIAAGAAGGGVAIAVAGIPGAAALSCAAFVVSTVLVLGARRGFPPRPG